MYKLSLALVHLNQCGAQKSYNQVHSLILQGHLNATNEGGRWYLTEEQLAEAKEKLCQGDLQGIPGNQSNGQVAAA